MPNPHRRSRILESPRRISIGIGGALLVVVVGLLWSARLGSSDGDEFRIPGDTYTFTVEVLNGTPVNRLARALPRDSVRTIPARMRRGIPNLRAH